MALDVAPTGHAVGVPAGGGQVEVGRAAALNEVAVAPERQHVAGWPDAAAGAGVELVELVVSVGAQGAAVGAGGQQQMRNPAATIGF